MSNVFLTNATGYIGSAVADLFKANGYEVSALARSKESVERLQRKGIKPITGDLKQPESFLEAVRNADVVIHTAATNDAEFAKVDETVVDQILKTLEKTNKTFIYTSGTWVLGNTGDILADETTPTNPLPLVSFRVEVENKILAAKNNGIKTIVIRPAIVYGRDGGLIAGTFATAKTDGYARYIGDGENHISTVHIDDLAKLYYLAAEKAQPGALFHASNDKALKLRYVAELVAEAAGIAGKVQSWPVIEARKVVGAFVDGFVLDQQIVSTQTKKTLGWEPVAPSLTEDLKRKTAATSKQ